MTRRIYKYTLEVTDVQDIQLPVDAQILTVQTQHGAPQLWAIVDADSKRTRTRRLVIHGTGHPVHEHADIGCYLGTFQLHDGRLVFHVFEVTHA